jgi:hypothetical protein
MESIESLVKEHFAIKSQIDELKARLSEVSDQIAKQAVFPEGKNTASASFDGIKVKVQRKEAYTWDQAKLNTARFALGDEKFLNLFRYKWEANKRALDGFMANASEEQKRPVEDALTVKKSFSVSTEPEA